MSASEYYSHTTFPSTGAAGSSSAMRAELESIETGFGKLPDLSGNGGEIVAVNSGATALEAITTTGTGSGVRATSPALTSPVLTGFVIVPRTQTTVSGGTYTLANTDAVFINISTATRATMTFELPTADLVNGQTHRIATDGAITAVTVSGGAATVRNAPTTLAAGGFFVMQYILASTTWHRVG